MSVEKMKVDGLGRAGVSSVDVNFPSNSKKTKEEPDKKIEKVVTGKVVERKKGVGKKFSEVFLGGDTISSVVGYMFNDVLIPAAKSTISDMVSSGIEMLLFGTTGGKRNTRGGSSKSYTSYANYYKSDAKTDRAKHMSSESRARHNFDDIILETRGEAEEVLSHLVDLTIDYGIASVADLYDLVGIPSSFTDNKYGWEDLSGATTSRVREGHLLNLPKTKLIN